MPDFSEARSPSDQGGIRRPAPSSASRHALDWFVFFLADVQTGFGAFVSVYLTAQKWTQTDIGLILTIGGIVGLLGQIPGGGRERRTWQLIAHGNHGPEIPCMASLLLVLKLSRGVCIATGARPCVGLLQLADFESEFARWDITTQVEVSSE